MPHSARQGITRLRKDDFEYAKLLGCTIKILGVTSLAPVEIDANGTVRGDHALSAGLQLALGLLTKSGFLTVLYRV